MNLPFDIVGDALQFGARGGVEALGVGEFGPQGVQCIEYALLVHGIHGLNLAAALGRDPPRAAGLNAHSRSSAGRRASSLTSRGASTTMRVHP